MQEIDLRKVDLNLLVLFDALMQERSISKAAAQLNRTQSAISHALERLRQQLSDPLLVRQGLGMVPSPFAEQLHIKIRPLLKQMASTLVPPQDFAPATSKRAFKIAMRDFLSSFFPDLLYLFQQQAPHARLDWVNISTMSIDELRQGALDVLIAPIPLSVPPGIASLELGGSQWACYVRENHPALARWDSAAWAAWPHIQVGVSDKVRNAVSEAAHEQGLKRQIAASVPLFSAVAPTLANTDYIATLPRAVMRTELAHWRLVEVAPPFEIAPIFHALYWSRRLEGDRGTAWLRDLAVQAIAPFIDAPSFALPALETRVS